MQEEETINIPHQFTRWMSWFFFTGSLILLIYTYYRSEIIFQGSNNPYYFKYYAISLLSILFWSITFRLNKVVRFNIVMIMMSLTIGAYLVEGMLSLLFSPIHYSERLAVAQELGIEFDKRTKLQVLKDLKAEGKEAFSSFVPSGFLSKVLSIEDKDKVLLPFGGVSEKTTVYMNESGRYRIQLSDRYGFTNPDTEWDKPDIEWLLTGDSFTQGEAVQQEDDIAGQIRYITNSSVINLGSAGNGPMIELAVLKEYAQALRPKKVLWIYYEGNDLVNLIVEKKVPLLNDYLQDGFTQNLMFRQKEIDISLTKYLKEEEQEQEQEQEQLQLIYYKTRWLRLHSIRELLRFDTFHDVDPTFSKILLTAKNRVEEWGGKLYFIYLPRVPGYKRKINENYSKNRFEVTNLVKGLDIPIIDIHEEVFANHDDPLSLFPLRVFGHYNAEGNKEVAEAIVSRIEELEKKVDLKL